MVKDIIEVTELSRQREEPMRRPDNGSMLAVSEDLQGTKMADGSEKQMSDWQGGQQGQGMEDQVLEDLLCHSKDPGSNYSQTCMITIERKQSSSL